LFGYAAERHADKLRAPKATVSFIGLLGAYMEPAHDVDATSMRSPRITAH
jgi:hypothetical protein